MINNTVAEVYGCHYTPNYVLMPLGNSVGKTSATPFSSDE